MVQHAHKIYFWCFQRYSPALFLTFTLQETEISRHPINCQYLCQFSSLSFNFYFLPKCHTIYLQIPRIISILYRFQQIKTIVDQAQLNEEAPNKSKETTCAKSVLKQDVQLLIRNSHMKIKLKVNRKIDRNRKSLTPPSVEVHTVI